MDISVIKKYKHFSLLAVALLIVAGAVLCLCMPKRDTNTKNSLYLYTKDFYDKNPGLGGASSAQSEILKKIGNNKGNDSIFYAGLRLFGRKMFERGDQILAFEYLKHIMSLIEQENNPSDELLEYKAYCCLLLGAATDEVGLTSLSQGYYFKGMKIADKLGDDNLKDDFYNNLGVSLYKSGDLTKAKSFFDTAMNKAVKRKNDWLVFIVHNNLADIYSDEGKFSEAIDHILKAINSVDANKNPEDYYSLQAALGSLYLKNGELPMAYACLSNAYRNQDSTQNKGYLYNTSLLLATYFNKVSQRDSVEKYMEAAWRMADVTKNPWQRIVLLETEAEMMSANGEYEQAYRLEKDAVSLKDSLHNEENIQRIEQAHNIYLIEKKAIESQAGIAAWNPVVVFVSMSVVVVLLAGFIIWIVAIKRKTERVIAEKAKTASDLADLRDRQLAEEKSNRGKADEDLRLYHQRLTLFTLERIKTNRRIDDISVEAKRALLKVPSRDKELRSSISDIISKLSMLQTDTQWDEFQYYFEKVRPDFYSNLDRIHPGLTVKDRRMCALISLGLSTKDIASITFLEIRSVESSRNRLRKKLGLDNDCNLFEYIKGLSHEVFMEVKEGGVSENNDDGIESSGGEEKCDS